MHFHLIISLASSALLADLNNVSASAGSKVSTVDCASELNSDAGYQNGITIKRLLRFHETKDQHEERMLPLPEKIGNVLKRAVTSVTNQKGWGETKEDYFQQVFRNRLDDTSDQLSMGIKNGLENPALTAMFEFYASHHESLIDDLVKLYGDRLLALALFEAKSHSSVAKELSKQHFEKMIYEGLQVDGMISILAQDRSVDSLQYPVLEVLDEFIMHFNEEHGHEVTLLQALELGFDEGVLARALGKAKGESKKAEEMIENLAQKFLGSEMNLISLTTLLKHKVGDSEEDLALVQAFKKLKDN